MQNDPHQHPLHRQHPRRAANGRQNPVLTWRSRAVMVRESSLTPAAPEAPRACDEAAARDRCAAASSRCPPIRCTASRPIPFDAARRRAAVRVKGRAAQPPIAADRRRSRPGDRSGWARCRRPGRRLAERFWPGPAHPAGARAADCSPPAIAPARARSACACRRTRWRGRLCADAGRPRDGHQRQSQRRAARRPIPTTWSATHRRRVDLLLDAGLTPGGAAVDDRRRGGRGVRLVRAGAVPWDDDSSDAWHGG